MALLLFILDGSTVHGSEFTVETCLFFYLRGAAFRCTPDPMALK
jgi:hypothetical protein